MKTFIIFVFFIFGVNHFAQEIEPKKAKNTPKTAKTIQNEEVKTASEVLPEPKKDEIPKESKEVTKDSPIEPKPEEKKSSEPTEEDWKKLDQDKSKKSGSIEVRGERSFAGITQMKDIEGTSIMTGKKTEVLDLTKLNANLTTNNSRQVYGKIPGVAVWENDGSGIQSAIGTRGLSPNRAWEFNVRQNGYDVASDSFGYPEAYYTPPLEAVEKIEIVRGAGSLQYGPQFGGLLNYVTKKADPNKPFLVETRQTGGSYNLFNSYNSVGGTSGKFSYFVFYHQRSGDGYRKNSEYKTQTGFMNLSYQFTEKLKIGFEFTRSQYSSRQAAGIQDGQFQYDPIMTSSREAVNGLPTEVNPRQSNRARNWFSAPWNVPVITLDYEIDDKTKLTLKTFGLVGERNSVGNTNPITSPDITRSTTGRTGGFEIEDAFTPRRIDRDWYRNYGSELRFIKSYEAFGIKQSSSMGLRYFAGNTLRIRNTSGTRGQDFTLSETNRIDNFIVRDSELNFTTRNYAAFYEHLFRITEKLNFTAGLRYETIQGGVSGHTGTGNLNPSATPISLDSRTSPFNMVRPSTLTNHVILGGTGGEYKVYKKTNLYANYTQAFRPVLFQELYAPGTTLDYFDPNLKNQSGYNADTGYRGSISNYLNFDVGAFQLKYNNRVGVIPYSRRSDIAAPFQRTGGTDSNPTGPNYRTNAGDSLSRGVEAYIEYDPVAHLLEKTTWGNVSGFVSYAQVNAKYVKTTVPIEINSSGERFLLPDNGSIRDLGIVGNRVENAPDRITRLGLTYTLKGIFSVTLQNSQIASVYTDASNTEHPLQGNLSANGSSLSSLTPNGQVGKLQGYKISDLSFTWNINEIFSIRGGVNNLENVVYATRRSSGYPGPGILPGDGRTFYFGIGAIF